MALQDGDTGVRTVDSITFNGVGDIGLISLVLVKPIATHYIRGIDAPVENRFFDDRESASDHKRRRIPKPSGVAFGHLGHGANTCWIKTLWA